MRNLGSSPNPPPEREHSHEKKQQPPKTTIESMKNPVPRGARTIRLEPNFGCFFSAPGTLRTVEFRFAIEFRTCENQHAESLELSCPLHSSTIFYTWTYYVTMPFIQSYKTSEFPSNMSWTCFLLDPIRGLHAMIIHIWPMSRVLRPG